jgi:hypothetical protein
MTANVEAVPDFAGRLVPKRPSRDGCHEDANESAKVVEEEPIEIERNIPDEPNPSIEGTREQSPRPPAFEE